MDIATLAKAYFSALPAFFILDMIWLGFIAKNFYRKELGSLLATNINWPAGIIFYLLFISGIVFFAVMPALNDKNINKAIINGAVFGFLAYATYDLTNLSTLKNWPLNLSIVDMFWGMILSAVVAGSSFFIVKTFFNA